MKSIIYFNTRDELIKVDIRKVSYFEADGNYVHIHFTNGIETMILTTLQNISKLLAEYTSDSDTRFIRVGKRYILNISVIYIYGGVDTEKILEVYNQAINYVENENQ